MTGHGAGTAVRGPAVARRLGWLLGTVCALALLGPSAPSRGAGPLGETGWLRIATWNMCGVRQWNCQDTGDRGEKIRALKRLAEVDDARVVMLQEVCSGDLETARRELGRGWRSVFRPYAYREASGRRTAVACAEDGQGRAGLAILAASPLTRVSVPDAQQPAVGLHRGMVCAAVAAPEVRVCNAHLSLPGSDLAHPGWEFRDDQLRALVGAADGRTVFGGDLNSAPPASGGGSRIWPDAVYGRYRECDQTSLASREGRPTLLSGDKVDYLFTALPRTGCSLRTTGVSDHRALLLGIAAG
ncbi:endonuclease/exonuclease/phosphatase family protein [Streptomyces sp. NPDC005899]|uniref:endonuclease/exonuclease/phosphatase family protein n=1 Tax=Streptomyces sp. NPDC005899 TaxID=3155716 RepID=UPI0033F8E7C6